MSRVSGRIRLLVPLVAGTLIVGLLPAVVLAASPSAQDHTVDTNEDTALPIVLTGTDPDGDTLTFAIDTGPTAGTLSALSDPAVCDGLTPSSCSVDVTYTPDLNATGPDSFTYTVSDGDTTGTATISITIDAANDPPAGTNKSRTTLEDTPVTIHTGDFGFSDPDDNPPNAFESVVVTSAPTARSLTIDGTLVSDNDEVSVADIAAGKLEFVPAPDGNGDGYATIDFEVRDDGGTAGTGADLDPSPNTLTIDVTSVNDAPDGVDKTVAVVSDASHPFATSDFGFNDPQDSPPDTLAAVKIISLPAAGALEDDGAAVIAGASIPAADIAASKLVFTPSPHAPIGAGYATFTFKVQDDGGTAADGVDLDPTANTIKIDITDLNRAPSGTDATVMTTEDTARVFGVADFGFSDPDDDPANGVACRQDQHASVLPAR